MEWLLIFVFGIVLWRAWRRISALEDKVRRLEMKELMRVEAEPRAVVLAPPPVPVAKPVRVEAEIAPVVVPLETPVIESLPPAPQAPPEPQVTLQDRLRQWLGDEELEALLGGSLLNKIGALVLVVGLSLLLGYSLTHMGPAGRVAVSLLLSGGLLGSGLWVERNGKYRVFSFGLLGAGWAGLYVTSYAMYALDAARVIPNETLGALLQFAVAAAMIAHTLKYASQPVTGVAAASAFAALAAAPSKQFGVGGLVPLAVALLYVVRRMRWHAIGLFCLIATYGIVIARGEQGSPVAKTQAFLFTLWLVFEAFDLIVVRSGEERPWWTDLMLPLNALGFVGLSAIKWQSAAPQQLPRFLAAAALLYLGDSVLRGKWRGEAYRVPLVISSGLGALAIVREAGAGWGAALLAVEAELLVLAAWKWRLRFVEWLGALVFCGSLVRLVIAAIDGHSIRLGGVPMHDWTAAAVLIAVLAYLNRELCTVPVPYRWFGAGSVQLVLGAETKEKWLGLVWCAWAAVQMELSRWRKADDMRRQSYVSLALGLLAVFAEHHDDLTPRPPDVEVWASLSGAAVLSFWMGMRSRAALVFAGGTAAALCVLYSVMPDVSVAVGWMALALLMMEGALWMGHKPLEWMANGVAGLAFGRLFVSNFTIGGETWGVSHRLLTVVPVAASFVALWVRSRLRWHLWAAAIALAVMLRFEMGRTTVIAGWAVMGLALLVLGLRFRLEDLRWQSYALALAVAARGVATRFEVPESFGGAAVRIAIAAVVVAALYAQEFLTPRDWPDGSNESLSRTGYSVAATLLTAVLLYRDVSGSLLTVAWGVQGLLLLGAGFPLRERVLRLSGLVVLLVCILKLFFHDLRSLETLPRILSFMALGVILLAVSWFYTRYRERLRRLL